MHVANVAELGLAVLVHKRPIAHDHGEHARVVHTLANRVQARNARTLLLDALHRLQQLLVVVMAKRAVG